MKKIGKLSVNTYIQKTYKVVLVSVNGAKLPEANDLENYLNEVYKQSVVSFEISTDELTLNDLTSFSHGGSGVLTVYNVDQKTVLRAYDPQMQDGVYYLFFIDNVTDKKDGNGTPVSGYMPRGYNAGFIYDGGSEHTIAHELGHGIAGLEHVFENSKSSGKTKNLMDYSSGEELWHFQWDEIQDPSRVWMKWNKDESEGENIEATFKDYYVFSPWAAKQLFSKISENNLSFEQINKELEKLSQIDLGADAKNLICNYKIKEPVDNYVPYYQRFNTALNLIDKIAYCSSDNLIRGNTNAIQLWYLELNKDNTEYEFKTRIFTGNDINNINTPQKVINNDEKSFFTFLDDIVSVFEEKHGNYVWSFTVSGEIKFNAYAYANMGVSDCYDLQDIFADGGGYIEGGIACDDWNVGLFGNIGFFLNYEYTIAKEQPIINLPFINDPRPSTSTKGNMTTYETVKSMDNYCRQFLVGYSKNFTWFWKFNTLIDIYGVGHTKSLGMGDYGLNFFSDGDGQSCGLGLSWGGKTVGIEYGWSSLSSVNYGYVMTLDEFKSIFKSNEQQKNTTLKFPYTNGHCKMTDKAYNSYINQGFNLSQFYIK